MNHKKLNPLGQEDLRRFLTRIGARSASSKGEKAFECFFLSPFQISDTTKISHYI